MKIFLPIEISHLNFDGKLFDPNEISLFKQIMIECIEEQGMDLDWQPKYNFDKVIVSGNIRSQLKQKWNRYSYFIPSDHPPDTVDVTDNGEEIKNTNDIMFKILLFIIITVLVTFFLSSLMG